MFTNYYWLPIVAKFVETYGPEHLRNRLQILKKLRKEIRANIQLDFSFIEVINVYVIKHLPRIIKNYLEAVTRLKKS